MPSANKTENYGFPQWAGNEYLKREDMNEAFAIADRELNRVEEGTASVIEEMLATFDRLTMQAGHTTTDTLTTQDGLDTWTSVITDASGNEVARKVDVESRNGSFAVWTSTITIGDKTVTVTDRETATGWEREVQ